MSYYKEFSVGDKVIWPNGTVSTVRAIDNSDDTLMDECGGWHAAYDVVKVRAEPTDPELSTLLEVRAEIRRVNDAAGYTVFNPAATSMVDALIRQKGGEA